MFGSLTNGNDLCILGAAAANANGVGPPSGIGTANHRRLALRRRRAPGAVPGNAEATVHWTAPANKAPRINGYVVTPYVDGVAQTATVFNSAATTETVLGLANGTGYRFRVAAKN